MFEKYDDVLTVTDVAEILFVGRNTVYDLLNSGHLKGFRIGKSWRVPKDPFWEQSEQSIFRKLLEFYFRSGMGFIDALSMILCNKLEVLLDKLSKPEMQFTSMFVGGATSMKPEALSSIEEGIRQKIEVFVYSRIAHAFRGNSWDKSVHRFDWDCLKAYNVFLRIPDDKIETWGRAINLLLGQLIHHLQCRGSKYDDPESIPTLLLMDEFAHLGKLEKVKSALTMLRSRNVTVCLMVQSFPQLEAIYGLDTRKIIADNCRTKVILGANDYDTQLYLSRLIGETKSRKRISALVWIPTCPIQGTVFSFILSTSLMLRAADLPRLRK